MNHNWRARAWMLFALLPPFGCTGTETGNPPRALISFEITSTNSDQFSFASDAKGVQVIHSRLGIERLTLEDCDAQEHLDTDVRGVVELVAPNEEFELPARSLCYVELVLSARDLQWSEVRSGANSSLSFGFAGQTPSDVPLFVEESQPISVVFRPEVTELSRDSRLSLVLDVAELLDYDELVQLPLNPDGHVLVDEQDNVAALNAIRGRWATSWSLYLTEGDAPAALVASGELQ